MTDTKTATKLKPEGYDSDTGVAMVYDTLCDRGHDPNLIVELLDGFDGDLWWDVFGPAVDRAAQMIGTTAYPDDEDEDEDDEW